MIWTGLLLFALIAAVSIACTPDSSWPRQPKHRPGSENAYRTAPVRTTPMLESGWILAMVALVALVIIAAAYWPR